MYFQYMLLDYSQFPVVHGMSPDYSEVKRKEIQDKLLHVILRLLSENPILHYYQGFHDIVITFLLVGGDDFAYAIVSVLMKYHIR